MLAVPRFHPSLSTREITGFLAAAANLVSSDRKAVDVFEKKFAEYIGVNNAVFVPSARTGLYHVLKQYELEPGDEILVPSYTYHSIPSTIRICGLKPVYIDIRPDTYLLDPDKITQSLTERTRAIVPTHLYGLTCSMEDIKTALNGRDILIIEDCAQCCGAEYMGKKAGSLGDAGYFTFGLTKNITCLSGGMVTTRDEKLAQQIKIEAEKYDTTPRGGTIKHLLLAMAMNMVTHPVMFTVSLYPLLLILNSFGKDLLQDMFDEPVADVPITKQFGAGLHKPNSIHALVGKSQLDIIDKINDRRREIAVRYMENLRDVNELQLPVIPNHCHHVFLNFVIRVKDRDTVAKRLLAKGVDTAKGYMKACSALGIGGNPDSSCPVSEAAERSTLHLPIYPTLKNSMVDYISEKVREAVMT